MKKKKKNKQKKKKKKKKKTNKKNKNKPPPPPKKKKQTNALRFDDTDSHDKEGWQSGPTVKNINTCMRTYPCKLNKLK